MSSATSIITIASGIVVGSAALYAINKGVEFDKVITKLEEDKDGFCQLVKNLLELGRDFLMRLYVKITELVKEAIFRMRIKASYY